MPDLFSPLRDSTESLPAGPEDIRRRGDRARRRRTALRGGVAVAAVAAVASGVLLLGPAPAPQIQPSPTPTTDVEAPTTIPADFPLAAGMIEGDESNDDPWLADIDYCDASSSMADIAVDDRFVQRLQPQLNQARSLELFDSPRTAQARALDHVEKFRSCPAFTTQVGSVAGTVVARSGLGDEGWTVSRSFTNDGEPQFGQEIYQVVRSGNALLITEVKDEGPGSTDPQTFDRIVQRNTASIGELVAEMCLWSEEGCLGG